MASKLQTPLVAETMFWSNGGVRLVFSLLGLASSVLWNQLLLSVGLLVQLFGERAIAIAATRQNVLCTVAMLVLTFAPKRYVDAARGEDRRIRGIALCCVSIVLMLSLGVALVASLLSHQLPLALFVLLVCFNGVATGTAQVVGASLGGMLSGRTSVANGALLVGEAASPLLTTFMAAAATYCVGGEDLYSVAVVALGLPIVALVAALVALYSLARHPTPTEAVPTECHTMGLLLDGDGDPCKKAELERRLSQVSPGLMATFCICGTWCFFLCSIPYVSAGICGSASEADVLDPACASRLSPLMVGASNMAAFAGRWAGALVPMGAARARMAEACVIVAAGVSVVLLAEGPPGLPLAAQAPSAVAVALSVGLTGWANVLLMRLSRAGHASADSPHSLENQCPVAAQLTWVALQSGCMTGSLVALGLRR